MFAAAGRSPAGGHSWIPVLCAEEAPPSPHRQTRNALGGDKVEIARHGAHAGRAEVHSWAGYRHRIIALTDPGFFCGPRHFVGSPGKGVRVRGLPWEGCVCSRTPLTAEFLNCARAGA